jgi:hypothetical protein
MDETRARRERGSALLVTVMLLLLMGLIGLASFDTVTQDRRVAGFQSRARAALYAADAGVSAALGILRAQNLPASLTALTMLTPALPATNLGDSSLYPHGRPSFAPEPGVTPISYLGSGRPCEGWQMTLNLGGGGALWLDSLWDLRVQGQTADGATSTVQGTGARCYAYNK